MNTPVLSRNAPARPARAVLTFLGGLGLPLARAHEVCGNARRFLAVLIAARTEGPVFWITPGWQPDHLNPESVSQVFDPGRITFLDPTRAEDVLWCMEEVLRSGTAPLVVADLPAPPGIVSVRRLHLAAETAAAETGTRPLGLLLTPGQGGAAGIETRWHIAADHGPGRPRRWRLDRLRARTEPQKSWQVVAQAGQFRLLDAKAASMPQGVAPPVASPGAAAKLR